MVIDNCSTLMSGKSRIAVEFISCPVFMIDIDMCPVSQGLKVVTDVLSMTLNALYMSLQVRS